MRLAAPAPSGDTVGADAPPAGATNALQSLITRLRRQLPDTAVLGTVPGGYRLDLTGGGVDVAEFEHPLTDGQDRAAAAAARGHGAAVVARRTVRRPGHGPRGLRHGRGPAGRAASAGGGTRRHGRTGRGRWRRPDRRTRRTRPR